MNALRSKPRIVFLDIDGVLNSLRWWADRNTISHVHPDIDPRAVELLNQLAPPKTTRIVVSSAWRLMGQKVVTEVLFRVGVKARVIGVTPDLVPLGEHLRGLEITDWLSNHHRASYVVVDDDADAGVGHEGRFVKTNPVEGLTAQNVSMALKLFEESSGDRG